MGGCLQGENAGHQGGCFVLASYQGEPSLVARFMSAAVLGGAVNICQIGKTALHRVEHDWRPARAGELTP